jgi:hypothetical protein
VDDQPVRYFVANALPEPRIHVLDEAKTTSETMMGRCTQPLDRSKHQLVKSSSLASLRARVPKAWACEWCFPNGWPDE